MDKAANFLTPMELDIEKFNPSLAELTNLKEEASRITADSELTVLVDMRKRLVSTRRKIEAYGLELRDAANKFSKAVCAKENELVLIIEPEEKRLKDIEAEVERRAIMEARKAALPVRQQALATIGDGVECSEAELLTMDDTAFTIYKAERITAWNEKESARIEAERRKLEEDKARIAREEQIKREAEERAKREADARVEAERKAKEDAERRLKEEQERAERERREAEERAKREEEARIEADRKAKEEAERERQEAERKAREEKERMEKQEAYRAFRADHGWTPANKDEYREENAGKEIVLWKKIGTFTI